MSSPSKKQVSLNVGVCRHQRREGVYAEGGHQIAIRCVDCTTILGHIGTCDGCGLTEAELYCLVPSARKRFCGPPCHERWKAARQRQRQQQPPTP